MDQYTFVWPRLYAELCAGTTGNRDQDTALVWEGLSLVWSGDSPPRQSDQRCDVELGTGALRAVSRECVTLGKQGEAGQWGRFAAGGDPGGVCWVLPGWGLDWIQRQWGRLRVGAEGLACQGRLGPDRETVVGRVAVGV